MESSIGVLLLPPLSPFHAHSTSSSSSSSSSSSITTPTQPSQQRRRRQQEQIIVYRISVGITDAATTVEARGEAWSCLVTLATFWFLASMILIMGIYSSSDLVLGPNCSLLLQANSFFVQDITVNTDEYSKQGPIVYEFNFVPPPLDSQTTWSEIRNASIPANFHKEWVYYLNKGARVNISYSLNRQDNTHSYLLLPKVKKSSFSGSINHQIRKQKYHGPSYMIIERPSAYYIAVGNLNQQDIEVQLNFSFLNVLYNATGANSKCLLDNKFCVVDLFMYMANFAVLTTPAQTTMEGSDEWHVKVSYGPRWATYIIASGILTFGVLLAFKIFTFQQPNSGDGGTGQHEVITDERNPLISNKDDENMSLGSSYESVSNGEEDAEEAEVLKMHGLGEADDYQQLCTICCDAKRDSFFLPCGHCAVCYTCGSRLLDEAGVCPICRRKMKKVRKIFTV